MPAKQNKYNVVDVDPLRKIFDKYDVDDSGYLDAGECAAALTQLGSKIKFEDLDTDGDNKVSFEEFAVFSQLTGRHTHPIFKAASKNIDTDGASKTGIHALAGDAHLNAAFMQTASKAWRKLSATKTFGEKELKEAFERIDIDHSGQLDEGEIRLAIKNVAPQITPMEIALMLATADKDGDHMITFPEWMQLMRHDAEKDVPYWEKYGERDMMTSLKDRRKKKIKKK